MYFPAIIVVAERGLLLDQRLLIVLYLLASSTFLGFRAVCRAVSFLPAVETLLRLRTVVLPVTFLTAPAAHLWLRAVTRHVSFLHVSTIIR